MCVSCGENMCQTDDGQTTDRPLLLNGKNYHTRLERSIVYLDPVVLMNILLVKD